MAILVTALRIDARGHITEVLALSSVWDYRWYKLDGSYTAGTFPDKPILNLRMDARGHVREVQVECGEPAEGSWYDLDGDWVEATGWPDSMLQNLRIDARGHIREVQMDDEIWYDLNGEAA